MSGFKFGTIGNIISKYMDTDYIDIKRDIDGKLQEVYSNVPCNLEMSSADNPDPLTIDLKPIIQSVTVHMNTWVDVQNNDFIVAKKMGTDGEVLQVYSGRCGYPATDQGRKKITISMSATDAETPTPPPPTEPADIYVEYKYDESDVASPEEFVAEIGSSTVILPVAVEGYTVAGYILDGGAYTEGDSVTIDEVLPEGHHIKFIYQISSVIDSFRYLVNGLYTRDDGKLESGLHLYKKISANVSDSTEPEEWIITMSKEPVYHEDAGMFLTPDVEQKMVMYPGDIWVKFDEFVESQNNNEISFKVKSYEPSEDEQNAYVTGWYDV